jgi:hypothetical protein
MDGVYCALLHSVSLHFIMNDITITSSWKFEHIIIFVLEIIVLAKK